MLEKAIVKIASITVVFALAFAGCGGGGDGNEDSGVNDDAGQDAGADEAQDAGADEGQDAGGDEAIDDGADQMADGAADEDQQGDQDIGSSCSCEGDECVQMGVPKPAGGTIIGCDDVPDDWTGAQKACMQTYEGQLATNTYFANGYCSLMATKCEGAELICSSAVFGDYDAMTSCPGGTVMVVASQDVEVFSQQATIDNKNCVVACETNDDCRVGEHDPVVDEVTQYQCIDKDGVKFCYDPRNLPAEYTATAF